MTDRNAAVLQDIFRAVFELPAGADVTALEQPSTPQWDSMAHIALVTAIESEFGISLEAAEQLQLTSYRSTLELVSGHGQ